MTSIKCPRLSDAAVNWLQTILRERLGEPLHLRSIEGGHLVLTLDGAETPIVFDRPEPAFLTGGLEIPCQSWNAQVEGWRPPLGRPLPAPGFTRLPQPLIQINQRGGVCHYDILGFAYWMLSRREEVGRNDLDMHGRFPASSSHAFKHSYLDRPVIDEWLDILRQILNRVWPQLITRPKRFDIKPSHDVDTPSRYALRSTRTFFRAVGADLFKRQRFADALRSPWIRLTSKNKIHKADPANTFDWIMHASDRHSLKSAFYFICGRTSMQLDPEYRLEDPAIRALMRNIHARGHEIGLHGSYGTYRSPRIIAEEANRLKRICGSEGIHQDQWGGRMHYLRWETPTTLNGWDCAGMTYDSTLGYADRVGFRCGTCNEYPAYDPVSDCALTLRIRPLIAMERTVMDHGYMGLGCGEDAFAALVSLKRACKAVGGTFSLLWHNTSLERPHIRDLYESVLSH